MNLKGLVVLFQRRPILASCALGNRPRALEKGRNRRTQPCSKESPADAERGPDGVRACKTRPRNGNQDRVTGEQVAQRRAKPRGHSFHDQFDIWSARISMYLVTFNEQYDVANSDGVRRFRPRRIHEPRPTRQSVKQLPRADRRLDRGALLEALTASSGSWHRSRASFSASQDLAV